MRFLGYRLLAGGLLLLTGCQLGEPSTGQEAATTPEAAFTTLEERLVGARLVELEFLITAEGAVEARIEGRLAADPAGVTLLEAAGEFDGEPVELHLRSGEGEFVFGRKPDLSEGLVPDHLHEALVIGFTRMGLLHNLAMLAGGAPPDGGTGGVREWVLVDAFGDETAEESPPGRRSVSFSITVGGIPVGEASLEIDGDGLPVRRRQTVQFPTGEMRVFETYSAVLIDP